MNEYCVDLYNIGGNWIRQPVRYVKANSMDEAVKKVLEAIPENERWAWRERGVYRIRSTSNN